MGVLIKAAKALASGALGGLANSIGLWIGGISGVNAMLDFNMQPALSIKWIVPRIVMSAVWGLLLLLPVLKGRPVIKGLVVAVAPLALMLFVFFPRMGAGMLGLNLGNGSPFMAAIYIAIWGVAAGLTWKALKAE